MKAPSKWRHKYLWLFLAGIVFAFLVTRSDVTREWLLRLTDYGYFGAFLGGVLFIFTFTTATGLIVIAELSQTMSPLMVGVIGGAGAVAGDMAIFFFARKELEKEVKFSLKRLGGNFLLSLLKLKPLKWLLPIVGAVIIASPFPDEIGVSLMGLSKIKTYKFFLLAFVLNAIGIFIVASASRAVTH